MVQYNCNLEECFFRFIQQVLCAELLNNLLILRPTWPPPPALTYFSASSLLFSAKISIMLMLSNQIKMGIFYTILMSPLIQSTDFIFAVPMEISALWAIQSTCFTGLLSDTDNSSTVSMRHFLFEF